MTNIFDWDWKYKISHQIVSPIWNSESTYICYDFFFNWRTENFFCFGPVRNLLSFLTTQTEKKSWMKLGKQIGENIQWIRSLNGVQNNLPFFLQITTKSHGRGHCPTASAASGRPHDVLLRCLWARICLLYYCFTSKLPLASGFSSSSCVFHYFKLWTQPTELRSLLFAYSPARCPRCGAVQPRSSCIQCHQYENRTW